MKNIISSHIHENESSIHVLKSVCAQSKLECYKAKAALENQDQPVGVRIETAIKVFNNAIAYIDEITQKRHLEDSLSDSTEWADGKRPDLLYVPGNEVTRDLPPILIEVQNQVDQRFMLRLINYCANVYDRYEVLPVVLVFVVENFSNTIYEESFVDKANAPYILETQCEHWAKPSQSKIIFKAPRHKNRTWNRKRLLLI